MNKITEKYKNYFKSSGLSKQQIDKIEERLKINLPQDIKNILKIYDGYYDIGGLSMFSFLQNNKWNVCEKTEFFRKKINLPKEYLVLQEGEESFIVLKTNDTLIENAPVFWIGISDVYNLIENKKLEDNPIIFPSFTDFFEFLLDEEEKIRAENNQKNISNV